MKCFIPGSNHVFLGIFHLFKVFAELEVVGKTLPDEVLDAGMPVHGDVQGDINKCPYYNAKMGMCCQRPGEQDMRVPLNSGVLTV